MKPCEPEDPLVSEAPSDLSDPQPADMGHVHMNERSTSFRDFCCMMLGSQTATPIRVGEDIINGALLGALVDAYKCCNPIEAPAKPGAPVVLGPHDPLGMLPWRAEPTQ